MYGLIFFVNFMLSMAIGIIMNTLVIDYMFFWKIYYFETLGFDYNLLYGFLCASKVIMLLIFGGLNIDVILKMRDVENESINTPR